MTFYQQQHEFYCGIDLHASKMYACIVDQDGKIQLHRSVTTRADHFLNATACIRSRDFVVGVESTCNWYCLADTTDATARRSSVGGQWL